MLSASIKIYQIVFNGIHFVFFSSSAVQENRYPCTKSSISLLTSLLNSSPDQKSTE